MLESISWQEFISTITLLIGGYYLITVLLLYGGEISHFFKQKTLRSSGTETKSRQNDLNESGDLMGRVRYESRAAQTDPRADTTNAEDIHVALTPEEEEAIFVVDPAEEQLRNHVASIQLEISSLIQVIPQRGKEEIISLFKTLLSNYPQFLGTTYQEKVSGFIHQACKEAGPHHFEPGEISSWWAESETTSKQNQ